MIYSPNRRDFWRGAEQSVSSSRPLRCVLPLFDPSDSQVAAWFDDMKQGYQLKEFRTVAIDMAEPRARPRSEQYHIYEFVPHSGASRAIGQRNRSTVEPTLPSALQSVKLSGAERFSP